MRYVLIGQKGSDQVLVVDTKSMTVSALDSASVVPQNIQMAREGGATHVDGIDLAVAVNQREDGSSIWYFENK